MFMGELLKHSDFKVDGDIIPQRGIRPFLRREVMMADLNTWAIGIVGPHNFGCKWYAGRARPEVRSSYRNPPAFCLFIFVCFFFANLSCVCLCLQEIAFLIAQGKLTVDDGVPSDVVDEIEKFDLKKATDFTSYPEGSPPHPSWPAMHSAASSASFWLSIVLDMTDEQLCQAKLVDYGVAFARTVAGVHYRSDNIAGLDLGQEVLSRLLPEHLATKYGASRGKVTKKINKMRHKWDEFDPWECIEKFGRRD